MWNIFDINIALLLSRVSSKFLWFSCEPWWAQNEGTNCIFCQLCHSHWYNWHILAFSVYLNILLLVVSILQSPSPPPSTTRKWCWCILILFTWHRSRTTLLAPYSLIILQNTNSCIPNNILNNFPRNLMGYFFLIVTTALTWVMITHDMQSEFISQTYLQINWGIYTMLSFCCMCKYWFNNLFICSSSSLKCAGGHWSACTPRSYWRWRWDHAWRAVQLQNQCLKVGVTLSVFSTWYRSHPVSCSILLHRWLSHNSVSRDLFSPCNKKESRNLWWAFLLMLQ